MKISVIIPVYNVEHYISKCLDSIKRQTLQDYEVVIVNDASTDKSIDIAFEYAQYDTRIKIFHNLKNLGLMETRKNGYKNASGDYFIFLDSDDYLVDNALETFYNGIHSENADIACADFIYVYDDGTPKGTSSSKLSYGEDSKSVYKSLLLGEIRHCLCGKIFKANLFRDFEYQTYPHFTFGEDGMLFYQIVKNIHKMIVLNMPLYYYVQHKKSSVHIRLPESSLNSLILMEQMRYNCTCDDKELERMSSAFITNELILFYYRGYGKVLDKLLEKHEMKKFVQWNYVNNSKIGGYLTGRQSVICIIKKHSPWLNTIIRFILDSNFIKNMRIIAGKIFFKNLIRK